MKNTSKKNALIQTAEEYASRSSMHGIGYVFDRDVSTVDRLLWLFLVLVFAGVAAALTWNFWVQWRNEQVIKTKEFANQPSPKKWPHILNPSKLEYISCL